MKITVYTIKDCAFSKQEKEYLNTNKLTFEEKDLETNKDFLTEMLAISNNFAGTPVTRVEKDDGTIAVLKGFTKEEFDTTFGFASPKSPTEAGSVVPPVVNDTPVPPTETVTPAPIVAESPVVLPTETPTTQQPIDNQQSAISNETPTNDPLKSVMDNLQAKADQVIAEMPVAQTVAPTPAVVPATVTPPVAEPPVIPVTPPAGAPAIPNFPAK